MISYVLEVLDYKVLFEEDPSDGGYTVSVPALPGCISEGDTLNEAKENISEAILLYLESEAIDNFNSQTIQHE